jgi:hypothetical protein
MQRIENHKGKILKAYCKKRQFGKYKAGALQYTLFISVTITLLLATFISLSYLQQTFGIQLHFFREVVQATEQSFEQAVLDDLPYETRQHVHLTENEALETSLIKRHWGLYDLVFSKSHLKSEAFEKIALLGGNNPNKPALYLKDKKQPLVVVGTTKITGTAYLPQLGVKTGYMGGKAYQNSKLIYGSWAQSEQTLPKIKKRTYLKNWIKNPVFEASQVFNLELGSQYTNSFHNKTMLFHSTKEIHLRDISLTGNIAIHSDTLVKIAQSASLKDILIIAPKIEVSQGSTGSFQAFASEYIKVDESCQLNYPTVLLLYEEALKTPEKAQKIQIAQKTTLQGVIAYLSDSQHKSYQSQINLEKEVVVHGEIFSDKNIDTQAQVYGTIYTDGFAAKQFGSIYQNHLYNSRINAIALPKSYVGLAFEDTQMNVLQWMY